MTEAKVAFGKSSGTVRTRLDIRRPANGVSRAEGWVVLVTETTSPWGRQWEVQATLVGEFLPRRWDTTDAVWLPWTWKAVPGVCVPAEPRVHRSLGAARADARQLALVLGGGSMLGEPCFGRCQPSSTAHSTAMGLN
jgi:hypothetical protein